MTLKIYSTNNINISFLLAIRTELDENKLTTLSHALSDFYNGFAKESKRITGKFTYIIAKFKIPYSSHTYT